MRKEHEGRAGPLMRIGLPTVDISGQEERHTIIARGSETDWQGHPHTLLLPDGKTMYCVWQAREGVTPDNDGEGSQTQFHGTGSPFLKKSDDGGRTWSERIVTPASWLEIGRGAPTIHRLVDADGKARLFVFCRDQDRTTFLQAVSEDDGETWSDLRPPPLSEPRGGPITGWTAPISILEAAGPGSKRRHLMWYERSREGRPRPGVIWQSASYDGGLSWGESRPVVDKAGASEPAVVGSPDGRRLLLMIRENDRELNSLFSVSEDEGETWSAAQELPLALTGDRHLARYAPDGRLVVVFRPRSPSRMSPAEWNAKNSHFTAWVGRFEDIVEGREGQCLVKLLHSYGGVDHTYPGLELFPDGTFVATTYIKYRPGPDLHSVVSVRFRLDEV